MSLETLVLSDEFQTYLQELRKSVDQPQNLSVMDMIEILFQHIDSIRTRDWKLFTDSIQLMLPWVLPYDSTNNGRWLPVLWLDSKSYSCKNLNSYAHNMVF